MKKLFILITLFLGICSCDVKKESAKQKNDIDFTERIETKEVRKGDTVTYIVPNVIYKDTTITTVSHHGTILKTYYDSNGKVSKSDCISAEIDLLRFEMRSLIDETVTKEKKKEESYFDSPLLWIIIGFLDIFNENVNE